MQKYKKIIIGVIIIVTILLLGIILSMKYMSKIGKEQIMSEQTDPEQDIEYQGEKYQYRDDIINILCIGVDKEEIMSERDDDGGSLGQADALVLVSLDLTENKIRMIAIPRDTMVTLKEYDADNNLVGFWDGQITLQYAYGDGEEESSQLIAERVSEVLQGIPINGYVSVNLSCIPVVNDAVGGVELTMDEDYTLYNPAFEKGKTVHLMGEEAKNFVQGRDIREAGSAYARIGRQKQYVQAFLENFKAKVKHNPILPLYLAAELKDNMNTDISVEEIFYLSTEVTDCSFAEDELYILPGEIREGSTYEEYYLTENAVTELLINLFYEKQ